MFELNIIFWTVYYLRAYSYRKQKTQNTELRNYTEIVSEHYFYYTQFIKFILYRSGILTKKWFQVGFEMRNEYIFDSKIRFSREPNFDKKLGISKNPKLLEIFGRISAAENSLILADSYRKSKILEKFLTKNAKKWSFPIKISNLVWVFDRKCYFLVILIFIVSFSMLWHWKFKIRIFHGRYEIFRSKIYWKN